jgi:hypothetical protein
MRGNCARHGCIWDPRAGRSEWWEKSSQQGLADGSAGTPMLVCSLGRKGERHERGRGRQDGARAMESAQFLDPEKRMRKNVRQFMLEAPVLQPTSPLSGWSGRSRLTFGGGVRRTFG